ncbi:hypothetical protein [Streptomyces sp. NBC_00233]|uniref:hypothetical protein n=1 Tax=Streptomyces sp. NBC_00233 TaxID=2975686 RepID=UPI00338F261C
MDAIGGILAALAIATNTGGFQQLADWAASFGRVLAFGIEGTGSYGATLTSFLRGAATTQGGRGRPAGPAAAADGYGVVDALAAVPDGGQVAGKVLAQV